MSSSLSRDALINEIESTLNEGQKAGFRECIHGTNSVFCTGEGGTGKSWLLECVVRYFREFPLPDDKLIAVTASTGIASFLIKGITLHRFAGTGIEETNLSIMIARASRGQSLLYWKNTDNLIIDEISMISATFFENLSLVAQHIRGSTLPFGGMRLLMFGDFLQLPPVSKIDHASTRVFHTDAWSELDPKTIDLRVVVRQTNPEFRNILSELRYGICSSRSEAYMQALDRDIEYDDGIAPVKLFSRRDTTDLYNKEKLHTLNTELHKYTSVDRGDRNSLKQCPAQQLLELKEGCQVILIRNLSSVAVNGSIGTVIGFEGASGQFFQKPIVKLTMPDGSFSTMTIGRVSWETIAPNGIVVASRVQMPLLLAWAITIHKSQGQTIPRLCVDMTGIFETGQAYVAISRCPNPDALQIQNFNKHLIMAASSCVEFYRKLQLEDSTDVLPDYTLNRDSEYPPEYSEQSAANAAESTQEQWANSTAPPTLRRDPTVDTQIMLGHLSLQETSTSSQLDFENS